jgi:hypothetical protein
VRLAPPAVELLVDSPRVDVHVRACMILCHPSAKHVFLGTTHYLGCSLCSLMAGELQR